MGYCAEEVKYGEPFDQKDRATPGACGVRVSGATECGGQGSELTEGLSALDVLLGQCPAEIMQLGRRSGRTAANWN